MEKLNGIYLVLWHHNIGSSFDTDISLDNAELRIVESVTITSIIKKANRITQLFNISPKMAHFELN